MSKVFYNAQNLTIGNGFLRNPDRYYLEDYFETLPLHTDFSLFSSTVARGTVNTNTTDETALASFEVPANYLSVGDVIHIRGFATVIGSNSTDTSTIKLRFGETSATAATTIATSAALDVADNDMVFVDFYIIIRTIGAAGTMIGHGQIRTDGNGATLLNVALDGGDLPDINTTTISYIGFTNTWSVANAGNQIAADSFIVEIKSKKIPNNNFVISGTSSTNSSVAFDNTRSGIILTTTTATSSQVIISPSTTTQQSPWNSIKWGTENHLEWECAISMADNTELAIISGLQNVSPATFDESTIANGIYFTNDTTAVKWKVIVRIASTTYISLLPVAIVNDIIYKFRITIDSSRFARVYINDIQYNITTVSGGTATTVTAGAIPSKQLTDDVDLIPYIGLENSTTSSATKTLNVYYQKISRSLYE